MGRPDGVRVKDIPRYRRMMPFFMRKKSESFVFWNIQVRADRIPEFCERMSSEYGTKVTPFMLVLHALFKALYAYPRANRFAKGGHIYQRKGIHFSFSVKKQMSSKAGISIVKKEFKPDFTLKDTVLSAKDKIVEARDQRNMDAAEKEAKGYLWIPSFIIRIGYPFYKFMDEHGLLSASYMRKEPLYASAFFANVGTYEMDAGYHHLYEVGTTSIFMVVGYIKDQPVSEGGEVVNRPIFPIKVTVDERMEDGFYLGRCMKYFMDQLENPEKLLEPARLVEA